MTNSENLADSPLIDLHLFRLQHPQTNYDFAIFAGLHLSFADEQIQKADLQIAKDGR